MRQIRLTLGVALVVLATTTGCGTTLKTPLTAGLFNLKPTAANSSETANSSRVASAKSASADSQTRSTAAAKPVTIAATAPAASTATTASSATPPAANAASAKSTRTWDPAVLAKIEAEAADATPEERERLIRELKDVEPKMVEQVLRIRRMGITYRKQQASGQAPAIASSQVLAGASNAPQTTGPATLDPAVLAAQIAAATGPDELQTALSQVAARNPAVSTSPPGASLVSQPENSVVSTAGPRIVSVGANTASSMTAARPSAEAVKPIQFASANSGPVILPHGAPAGGNTAETDWSQDNAVIQHASTQTSSTTPDLTLEGLPALLSELEDVVQKTPLGKTDAEHRQYIQRHVILRFLYLAAGQQERAVQAIPGLTPANQEFWQQTLWGLVNYFDANPDVSTAARMSMTVKELSAAIQRLQEQAQLELRNTGFCYRISSYGDYDRFPVAEFTPGKPVLVYTEVQNFASERLTEGGYRTTLKSSVEIYRPGANGELEESINIAKPIAEDLCKNFRRDFFLSYEFNIPTRLSPGPHVLKLIVEDQISRKVATTTLNFTVRY